MNEIYTITSVHLNEGDSEDDRDQERRIRPRCWTWAKTREEAIEWVKQSADWYSECSYYTHVIIEKCEYRKLPYDRNPTWIKLRKLDKPKKKWYIPKGQTKRQYYTKEYEAIVMEACPKGTERIVGWGIG